MLKSHKTYGFQNQQWMNEWLTNTGKFKTERLFWSVSDSSRRHQHAGRWMQLLKGFQHYNIRFQSSWKLTCHLGIKTTNQIKKAAVHKKGKEVKKNIQKIKLRKIPCVLVLPGVEWIFFTVACMGSHFGVAEQCWYYRSPFVVSEQSLHKDKAFSAPQTIPPARRLGEHNNLGGGHSLDSWL